MSVACAGAGSVKVSNPEQASAVDVEMKDATGDADPKDATGDADPKDTKVSPKAGGGEQQSGDAPLAKEPPSATGDKDAHVWKTGKLETTDKKEKESIVDEDLVRAFRYFDKTGMCWCEPLCCTWSFCWSELTVVFPVVSAYMLCLCVIPCMAFCRFLQVLS